jgi:cytochrome c biogenesis protein CcdA
MRKLGNAEHGTHVDSALNLVSLLGLGFFFGMRHATDADHIVAVATIVSSQKSMRSSALIGMAWGIGHTITVTAVGAAIIVFGIVIPPRIGLSMELAVGIMLILLGVLTLTGMGRTIGAAAGMRGGGRDDDGAAAGLHDHVHAHGDYVHRHVHGHGLHDHGHGEDHTPVQRLDRSRLAGLTLYRWLRPFAVGLVHGLAGSAAIALMVLSVIRDPLYATGYLLLFGLGTIGGMMLVTLALAAPFTLTSVNLPRFNWRLRVASGLISFVFGLFLVYAIGFADGGLFTENPHWEPH